MSNCQISYVFLQWLNQSNIQLRALFAGDTSEQYFRTQAKAIKDAKVIAEKIGNIANGYIAEPWGL